jgi:plastocyanin
MRTIIARCAAAALLVAVSGAGATASSTASHPATKTVAISDYSFKPATIAVAPGTRIVWTNKDDDPHTVTADDGSFDSKGLGQGDAFGRVFAKPGRYPYHCSAHPFMKGVVIVTKGSTP